MDYIDILYMVSGLLLLPMIIYSLVISLRVRRVFATYSTAEGSCGLTADKVARRLLDSKGLTNVNIVPIRGSLTDNFNPRDNTLYLSESVYGNTSIAAIGVAAHEAGHAIQYATGYTPLVIRSKLVPVVNVGSRLAIPLLILGVLAVSFGSSNGIIGQIIIYAAIALYGLSTLFAFVTLPVEFNASKRAKELLVAEGYVGTGAEINDVDKVLSAAGKTYLASFAVSLLYLLRLLAIFGRRNK